MDISALSRDEVAALFGRKPTAPLELTLWRTREAPAAGEAAVATPAVLLTWFGSGYGFDVVWVWLRF